MPKWISYSEGYNQSAARIRKKLQADKDIVVAIVPYHLHE